MNKQAIDAVRLSAEHLDEIRGVSGLASHV